MHCSNWRLDALSGQRRHRDQISSWDLGGLCHVGISQSTSIMSAGWYGANKVVELTAVTALFCKRGFPSGVVARVVLVCWSCRAAGDRGLEGGAAAVLVASTLSFHACTREATSVPLAEDCLAITAPITRQQKCSGQQMTLHKTSYRESESGEDTKLGAQRVVIKSLQCCRYASGESCSAQHTVLHLPNRPASENNRASVPEVQ